MATYSQDKIRNIALVGHPGEGKTSLTEAILYLTKGTDRQGKVEDGNTVSDFDPEEISRKASINLSLAYTYYNGYKFNILDVPGFFDFEGERVAALSVADAAIVVCGANGTLTPGAEITLDYCVENNIPAMIFINGINKENTSFQNTYDAIKARYGIKLSPMLIPIMNGTKPVGYVDVIAKKAFDTAKKEIAIPADLAGKVEEDNAAITEVAAEGDEELMNKFFETMELSPEEIMQGLKIRFAAGEVIPVTAGAAAGGTELFDLLDRIVTLCPSPAEARGFKGTENGKEKVFKCDSSDKTVLKIFKTIADAFGKMLLFKVVSGKLETGVSLYNPTADKLEKINNIAIVKGKKQETVDSLQAGDMGVLTKLAYTTTNDTLCQDGSGIVLEAINFPKPVISLAVSAVNSGEEDKVISNLIKLQEEDVTFKVENNTETNQVLLSGLGEAQINLMCKKLYNKFKVQAALSEPKVAYKETIRKTAEAEGKHKKQSGGAGQFGVVYIKFEPGAADGIFEFVDAVVGGAVPRQFIPAVEKGLREAIKAGVLAGYPMVNLKATLFDGKYHPVDSKEIAFVTAAKLSYDAACRQASPCFLEPIYEATITVTDSYLGDIMGDMNKRRGRILGTDSNKGKSVITAEVPQAEMFKYATDLRAMTQGRGKFEMKFVRYEQVAPDQEKKIIEAAKKEAEGK